MRLGYATIALIEMDDIADFIQGSRPRSALRFLEAVEKTAGGLLAFPELGTPYESNEAALQGVRICQVSGFDKYLIVYRVRNDEIKVLHVLHGHRDLPQILKESL